MNNIASSDTISHKTWAAPLICGAHNKSSRGNPLLELKINNKQRPGARNLWGVCVAAVLQGVKTVLTDGFDFSSTLPTPLEVTAIREALVAGLIAFPNHAVQAALDDGVTPEQVFKVIEQGIPVEKDFPDHRSRVSGISFEGRVGGSRKARVKVSWDHGYYVVTIHAVKQIKRRKSR